MQESELMLDYPCLLYMIGNGSLSLKANERVRERTLSLLQIGEKMKYQITLEVESDWELKQLIKGQHGALVFASNHPWKVLEAFKIEGE